MEIELTLALFVKMQYIVMHNVRYNFESETWFCPS